MKLVSIITPMYNAEKYIAQTIESVQKQTYSYWEMIIMDDQSTDKGPEIVARYAKEDPRIRYYREESHAGVAQARNDAMTHAKGEYMAFLDSDDLWKPLKLEKQLELMEREGCVLSYTACDVVDDDGIPTAKIRHVPERITYKKLLHGNVIPCLTVMVNRKLAGDIRMPEMRHEDYATWLGILKNGNCGMGLDEVLGTYRLNRNSISHNKWKVICWTWNIYRKQCEESRVRSLFYVASHLFQALKKYI